MRIVYSARRNPRQPPTAIFCRLGRFALRLNARLALEPPSPIAADVALRISLATRGLIDWPRVSLRRPRRAARREASVLWCGAAN